MTRNHLIFLAPRAADPVVTSLVDRLTQPPPDFAPNKDAWAKVTTTVLSTRDLPPLICRPDAMQASSIGGIRLDAIRGVYLGALPPRVPGLGPHEPSTAQERLFQQQAADGLRDALCAMLSHLARSGRPVLNSPQGGTMLQNKLQHLDEAVLCGLKVPATVAGDRTAAGIPSEPGGAIDKPVRAWSPTQPAKGALAPGLMRQRRIVGTPARVLILDGHVLDAVRIEGTRAVDHRADPVFRAGNARYVPVTVPSDVLDHARQLLDRLALRFAGLDFMVDEEGWWFLEANAAPIWVEQAQRTGADVAGALLAALIGEPDA